MCFFIGCKDGNAIVVEHVTEAISYSRSGQSDLVADVLISMPSANFQTQCNELVILYPNRFYVRKVPLLYKALSKIPYLKLSRARFTLVTADNSIFENLSQELTEGIDAPKNKVYKINKYSLDVRENQQYDGCSHSEVTIKVPSDLAHDRHKELSGFVLAKSHDLQTLEPDNISNEHEKIALTAFLQNERFTPFSLKLDSPLRPGASGWFRFRFKPISTNHLQKKFPKRQILRLTNNLVCGYQIVGPVDVLNRFRERIRLNRHVISERQESDLSEGLLNNLNLAEECYSRFFQIEKTFYKRWQIHLLPQGLGNFVNFVIHGNSLESQGTLPNIESFKDNSLFWGAWPIRKQVCSYDWEAVWDDNNDSKEKKWFKKLCKGVPASSDEGPDEAGDGVPASSDEGPDEAGDGVPASSDEGPDEAEDIEPQQKQKKSKNGRLKIEYYTKLNNKLYELLPVVFLIYLVNVAISKYWPSVKVFVLENIFGPIGELIVKFPMIDGLLKFISFLIPLGLAVYAAYRRYRKRERL